MQKLKIKKKGNGELFASIVGLFSILVITLVAMSVIKDFYKKNTYDSIARTYILKMETAGFLTPTMETSLLEELRNNGMTNISLEGTTKTMQTHGSPITLDIEGTTTTRKLLPGKDDRSDPSFWEHGKTDVGYRVTIRKKSTAKNM